MHFELIRFLYHVKFLSAVGFIEKSCGLLLKHEI